MKRIINEKIKFREGFRPFCPSVLEEDFNKVFSSPKSNLPYMTVNVDVIEEGYPSITHVNNTARVQTIGTDNSCGFTKLLEVIKSEVGIGITVNTSFNRKGEAMVYSPRDAVSCFFGSGLDYLVMGNYVISKT